MTKKELIAALQQSDAPDDTPVEVVISTKLEDGSEGVLDKSIQRWENIDNVEWWLVGRLQHTKTKDDADHLMLLHLSELVMG